MRWTKLREEIYKDLEKEKKPMCAHELKEFVADYDLSNIYRALNYLEKENMINSISLKGTSYYFLGAGHFLYCKDCGELKEFNRCVGKELMNSLEKETEFDITNHTLLFEGRCKKCREEKR